MNKTTSTYKNKTITNNSNNIKSKTRVSPGRLKHIIEKTMSLYNIYKYIYICIMYIYIYTRHAPARGDIYIYIYIYIYICGSPHPAERTNGRHSATCSPAHARAGAFCTPCRPWQSRACLDASTPSLAERACGLGSSSPFEAPYILYIVFCQSVSLSVCQSASQSVSLSVSHFGPQWGCSEIALGLSGAAVRQF